MQWIRVIYNIGMGYTCTYMWFVSVGICGPGGRCRDVAGGHQCICPMGRIGSGCRQSKGINIIKFKNLLVFSIFMYTVFLNLQKVTMFMMLKAWYIIHCSSTSDLPTIQWLVILIVRSNQKLSYPAENWNRDQTAVIGRRNRAVQRTEWRWIRGLCGCPDERWISGVPLQHWIR